MLMVILQKCTRSRKSQKQFQFQKWRRKLILFLGSKKIEKSLGFLYCTFELEESYSAKNLMNLSSRWKNYECRGVSLHLVFCNALYFRSCSRLKLRRPKNGWKGQCCKKVKTLLFWLHCRPRHFFTCVLGSADFHCCTQNFAGLGKKTRSQLLFCFLKNSNRRETKTFQTHTSLQSIVKSSGRSIWISCLKIKSWKGYFMDVVFFWKV